MVDYSKWDKLDVSDSESDDDNPQEGEDGYVEPPIDQPKQKQAQHDDDDEGDAPKRVAGPAVYRIGQGETLHIPGRNVTITSGTGGGGGSSSEKRSTSQTATEATGAAKPGAPATTLVSPATASTAAAPSATGASKVSAAQAALRMKLTRNGGETDAYWWAQDENHVVLSVVCAAGTKAADVRVSVTDERKLTVSLTDGTPVYSGELYAPLDFATSAQVNSTTPVTGVDDWEMLDAAGLRLLSLTLKKKPLSGMVLWWRAAFKGGAEIAPEALVDRSTTKRSTAESFQSAFEKAQQAFLEKMKAHPPNPMEIDVEDDKDGKEER